MLTDGDTILRRGAGGRVEIDQANRDARISTPAPSLVKPRVRSWPAVATVIAQRAEQAVADPNHPWSVRWPTAPQMAQQFDTSRNTIYKALHHLHEQGVLVKAWVDRPGGPQQVWVPRVRALGLRSKPSIEQIAAEIVRRGLRGEWAVLPWQVELAEHFFVSRPTINKAIKLLAERCQVVKLRVNGKQRWQFIQPYQVRSIDPRLTVPVPRVVVMDLIRRIRDGEFRYRLPPDPTVHDRPFLANTEIKSQYRVSLDTVAKVKKKLRRLGWIVPGERSNTQCRLAEHVPPVERTSHPAPRKPRKPRKPLECNRRARELADDLIARIRAGAFERYPFPSLVTLMAEYHAGWRNVTAALEELERDGWIEFRAAPSGRGRVAMLLPVFGQWIHPRLPDGGVIQDAPTVVPTRARARAEPDDAALAPRPAPHDGVLPRMQRQGSHQRDVPARRTQVDGPVPRTGRRPTHHSGNSRHERRATDIDDRTNNAAVR